jgi:GT2 family glycosyltransferase
VLLFQELELVIVDNDPRQDFVLPSDLNNRASVMRSGGKCGFSEANNLGVETFLRDQHNFILILNNDTFVVNNSLKRLYEVLMSENVAAVGPKIFYANEPEKVWACGGSINNTRLLLKPEPSRDDMHPYEVDYLPGAVILCKSDLWKRVGGFSERYFLAYEEAEFAVALKRLGYCLKVEPSAEIFHHVGMSSDNQPMYIYNAVRNRMRFGEFLHGRTLGIFLSIFNTCDIFLGRNINSRNRIRSFKIWIKAVSDELIGRPLDREILIKTKTQFEST